MDGLVAQLESIAEALLDSVQDEANLRARAIAAAQKIITKAELPNETTRSIAW